MPSIAFTDGVTVIPASWLNDVNSVVFGAASPQTVTLAGDISGTGTTGSTITTTLPTVNSTVGTFGTSIKVPRITTNAKGQITNVTEVNITTGSIGTGGQTITDNTTLTISSPSNIIVGNITAIGKYITLPDATTGSTNISIFTVQNNSSFDFGIKDSTGTKLGWISPDNTCTIGLNSNATAAGIWTLSNINKVGLTSSVTTSNPYTHSVKLDSNRTLFYTRGTSVVGRIHDASTNTWGSETTIFPTSTNQSAWGIKTITDQACFVTMNTTNHLTVVCTCTGTTISVGTIVTTAASTTTMSSCPNPQGIAYVNSAVCFTYGDATNFNQYIRAIIISGTVPVLGTEVVLPGSGASNPKNLYLFSTGNIVRVVGAWSGSGGLFVRPFTVSGFTLTGGTAATYIPGAFSGDRFSCFQNSNGNIIIIMITGISLAIMISVLVSTTETITQLSTGIGLTGAGSLLDELTIYQVTGTTFAVSVRTGGLSFLVTDTSGTLSKTTTSANLFPLGNPVALSNTGNVVKYITQNSGQLNQFAIVYVNYGVSPPVVTSTIRCILSSASTTSNLPLMEFPDQRQLSRNISNTTIQATNSQIQIVSGYQINSNTIVQLPNLLNMGFVTFSILYGYDNYSSYVQGNSAIFLYEVAP